MSDKNATPPWHLDTLAVRAAVDKSQYGENSEALYLTSSFTQPDSETAALRFAGEQDGYIYSRFTNPTTASMEKRLAALEGAPSTKLLFAETPTNPLTDVCDIRALADLAHNAKALLAVDNCFCTPALQRPISLGADIVVHSGTKYLDGQGRVVAGALCASEELVHKVFVPVMRSAGMSLSPFNAWVVLKGMETRGDAMLSRSLTRRNSCRSPPIWVMSKPSSRILQARRMAV